MSFVLVSCSGRGGYISFSGYAQGGVYTVKMNLDGVRRRPEVIRDSVEAILSRVDRSVSGYNKASILSRLNAGETVAPDGILTAIYDTSFACFKLSDGAFDVSAGPLFDIWGFGFKNDTLPSPSEVAEARLASGMSRLHPTMEECLENGKLCSRNLLIEDSGESPVLNFNAIAQGFTCDLVAQYLHSIGVKDMLVDIGEIWCEGLNPSGNPWSIGVDRPFDGNNTPGAELQGIWSSDGKACGLVTSGNYRKFYVRDGKKYAHTIDPRTGEPVSHNLLSATIMAPTAAQADALATYCMVIGTEAAKAFIESSPGIEGYLISSDGAWNSAGFTLRQ